MKRVFFHYSILIFNELKMSMGKNADDKMEAFPSFEVNRYTPEVATVIYKCHSKSIGLELLLVATISNLYVGYAPVRYCSYIYIPVYTLKRIKNATSKIWN